MLEGHMLHTDHLGNRGDLRSGDVQWMTAGRGIVHSEMPQQESGRMRGFQLWLNLPAAEKMQPPAYRDIPQAQIPVAELGGGSRARVVAGELGGVRGPIRREATDPLYADIELAAGASFRQRLPASRNAFVYLFEGEASVGLEGRALPLHAAGVLGEGDEVAITAGAEGARLLVLAGRPLGEPVAQWGPFVMNTREEVEQAILDYRQGRLTEG
jgi:redox-sensitive bicupin YhaK (pirin superfamily)